MLAKGRASHNQEAVCAGARHGKVALDAAARVERLRVHHRANRPVHIVGADVLQKRQRAGTAHFHNEIAVAVRDRGPGFKPEQREQMFDAFYSTKRGNMGMGLSISRTIVEAHGGTLRAHNNDDGGATFEVKLPGDGGVFGRAR